MLVQVFCRLEISLKAYFDISEDAQKVCHIWIRIHPALGLAGWSVFEPFEEDERRAQAGCVPPLATLSVLPNTENTLVVVTIPCDLGGYAEHWRDQFMASLHSGARDLSALLFTDRLVFAPQSWASIDESQKEALLTALASELKDWQDVGCRIMPQFLRLDAARLDFEAFLT